MEYLPRKIEKDLEKWINRGEVILIKGPRQSGKTTLLKYLQKKYGGTYVSLEFDDQAQALVKDPLLFGKRYIEGKFLYIDEAQYVKDIGKYVKILYDHFEGRLKIFVSGSGSFEVKESLGKYLVGRAIYFELLPLSFEEFLLWKDRGLYEVFTEQSKEFYRFLSTGRSIQREGLFEREFLRYWEEFLLYGGYPAVAKEQDEEVKVQLLKNLLQTYLEKDVFFFLGVRELEKFRSLLKSISFLAGSLLELSSLAKELRMDYRTALNYLDLLIQTYIVESVSSYHRNLVTELKKAKKVYFLDTGLRNAILNNFSSFDTRADKGVLLENFVFSELRKSGLEVKFWRTSAKAEVDFIVFYKENLLPLEVKLTPEITRSFISFLKSYSPERAIIISLNLKGISSKKLNHTEIIFYPCFYL